MISIGIDPGKSGGLVAIHPDGEVEAWKMPATERDIWSFFGDFNRSLGRLPPVFAAIEKVHSMPGQGVASCFAFGMGYGGLRMALIAAGIPFETVTPQKWQKALGCLSKGDKNVTKARAQELFPAIKVTHAIADALLIAEYCRRTHAKA
jgi:crossover junction endodeoxyribonuclease RuvC